MNCPICMESYDKETKLPKVLDCAHTVCLACLDMIVTSRSLSSDCPICHTPLRNKAVRELPTNDVLVQLLDQLNSQSQVPAEQVQPPLNSHREQSQPKPVQGRPGIVICRTHKKPFKAVCSCGIIVCGDCKREAVHEDHSSTELTSIKQLQLSLFNKENIRSVLAQNRTIIDLAQKILSEKPNFDAWREQCERQAATKVDALCHMAEEQIKKVADAKRAKIAAEFNKKREDLQLLEQTLLPALKTSLGTLATWKQECIRDDKLVTSEELVKNSALFQLHKPFVHHYLRARQIRDQLTSSLGPTLPCPPDPYIAESKALLAPNFRQLCDRKRALSFLPAEPEEKLQGHKPAYLCWDAYSAYCLQGRLLYVFPFLSQKLSLTRLQVCVEAEEYLGLSDFALVAAGFKCLYVVGGFVERLGECSASCFCISAQCVTRIPSMQRPRAAASAVYFRNHILAIGGKMGSTHLYLSCS